MINEFENLSLTFNIGAGADGSVKFTGSFMLGALAIDQNSFGTDVMALFGMAFGFYLVAFSVLHFAQNKKR
jgi:hypothetical protein